jgi:CBS domain-containing protein
MDDRIIQEEEQIAQEQALEAARVGNALTTRPIRALPGLRPAICVQPSSTVREAIDKMNEHRMGCVLVEDQGRLVGVYTERDVLTKVAARGLNADTTCVGDMMTPDPESLTLDDGIAYALNKMSRRDADDRRVHLRPLPGRGAQPSPLAGPRHLPHAGRRLARERLQRPPPPGGSGRYG